jgi:MerR family transcriptional regulator, copper efflux regulator
MMNIGDAAEATGVSAKMIRYYERIGLIRPAARTHAGYRTYSSAELHDLRFIKRSRVLGFSVERIRQLLDLWRNTERPSAEVKQIALEHVAGLDAKIAELCAMRDTLRNLADHCTGDHRPECPILEDLARDPRDPRGS